MTNTVKVNNGSNLVVKKTLAVNTSATHKRCVTGEDVRYGIQVTRYPRLRLCRHFAPSHQRDA